MGGNGILDAKLIEGLRILYVYCIILSRCDTHICILNFLKVLTSYLKILGTWAPLKLLDLLQGQDSISDIWVNIWFIIESYILWFSS